MQPSFFFIVYFSKLILNNNDFNFKEMKKIVILAFIMLGINNSNNIQAQEYEFKKRPFQVTFITPVGTNGTNSSNFINELSL